MRITRLSLPFVRRLIRVLEPVTVFLQRVIEGIVDRFYGSRTAVAPTLTDEEMETLVEIGREEGTFDEMESRLLRETMNSLEARIDPERFLRIHRSTMVNIERIQELQPWFHGDYLVILRDGTQLTLSRSYRQKLQDFFGNTL